MVHEFSFYTYYIIYSYIHIYETYIYFTIMFLYNYIFYILF